MSRSRTLRCLLLMGCLALAACATPVPVATHSLRCDAEAGLLINKCARPKNVPDGATFESVVDVMREDRQALLECGMKVAALQESIMRCNQQADRLNTQVDRINEANRAD